MIEFINKLDTLDIKNDLEIEPFFIKVDGLLKTIKQDMVIAFQNKQNTFTSIVEHQEEEPNYYESFYIASKNRLDTLKNTISYLLSASKLFFLTQNFENSNTFDTDLLSKVFYQSTPLHYSDFLESTHFLGELLMKDDVRAVVIKNYQNTYPNSRTYDINKYVMQHLKEFKLIAPSKNNYELEHYKETLYSLQHLSKLWFKIKDGNIKHIRKSDIYIYQLCRILLKA